MATVTRTTVDIDLLTRREKLYLIEQLAAQVYAATPLGKNMILDTGIRLSMTNIRYETAEALKAL